MNKIIITFSILLFGVWNINAQDIKRTLINDHLDELFINKDNPFGPIPIKTVENFFEESNKIYFFEIVYNEKILFREAIRKAIPQSQDSETMSIQVKYTYNNIYLNSANLSDSDKLKLLESYKNKIIDISGKKILDLHDYQIIKKDYNRNKYIIMDPLENMKINVYRIEFK